MVLALVAAAAVVLILLAFECHQDAVAIDSMSAQFDFVRASFAFAVDPASHHPAPIHSQINTKKIRDKLKKKVSFGKMCWFLPIGWAVFAAFVVVFAVDCL